MGQIGDFEFILSSENNDEDDLDCADDLDNYGNGDVGGEDVKTMLMMTMTMMMTTMKATMMTMIMMMIRMAEISNVLELQTKLPGRLWFPTT